MAKQIAITSEDRTAKSGQKYVVFTLDNTPYAWHPACWIAPDQATMTALGNAILAEAKKYSKATDALPSKEDKQAAKAADKKTTKTAAAPDAAALLAQMQALMAQMQASAGNGHVTQESDSLV